jgi:hypothetical protein
MASNSGSVRASSRRPSGIPSLRNRQGTRLSRRVPCDLAQLSGYQPAVFANGSVLPFVAIGWAMTKNGSKVLPEAVRPS